MQQLLKQSIIICILMTIAKTQNGRQPPIFPTSDTTVLALAGQPFELDCDVNDITIFFNGYYLGTLSSIIMPVVSNNRFNVSPIFSVSIPGSSNMIYRKTLTFNNVSKFDAGTYYCGNPRIAIRMVVLKDNVVFQPFGVSNNKLYVHLRMEFYSGNPLIVYGKFYSSVHPNYNSTFGGNILYSDRPIDVLFTFYQPFNGVYALTFKDITTTTETPQSLLFTL